MASDVLSYTLEGKTAVVRMDDGKANALSEQMIDSLVEALTRAEKEAGAMLWRSWFETLRVCEESDFWPGYSQQVITVCAPGDDGDMPDLVFSETEEAAE